MSQGHLHIRSGDPIFSSAVSWQMKQASSFWEQAGASSTTSLSSGRGAISQPTFARATELDNWTLGHLDELPNVCESPIKMNRGEITKRDRENPFGRTADGRPTEVRCASKTKFRSDRRYPRWMEQYTVIDVVEGVVGGHGGSHRRSSTMLSLFLKDRLATRSHPRRPPASRTSRPQRRAARLGWSTGCSG